MGDAAQLPLPEPELNLAWHLDMALTMASQMCDGDTRQGLTLCIQQLQGQREWQRKAGVKPTVR